MASIGDGEVMDSLLDTPTEDMTVKPSFSSVVHLNVGGSMYSTTVETLTHRETDSMLGIMFSGRHRLHLDNKGGAVFIDRDGTHFRHILNWLRDGIIPAHLDLGTMEELLREATYYQLHDLMEALSLLLAEPKRKEEECEAELTRKEVVQMLQCGRMRLRGVNLRSINLSKLDLSGVDFSFGRLHEAFFSCANLEKAEFKEVEADGSNFHKANMRECALMGASLRGALLAGATLQSANMEDAVLVGATLCGADLRSAHLQNADLSDANLCDANLEGANLKGAKLNGANLTGANLTRAYMRNVDLRDTNLAGANVNGANLAGTQR